MTSGATRRRGVRGGGAESSDGTAPSPADEHGGIGSVTPAPAPLRVPASKIAVPELPDEFTPRPALRDHVDRATAADVVLVSAPAGFGKTLLLADWVRNGPGPETAWISLDRDDNDPRRLWSAVLASLLAVPSIARDREARGALEGARSFPADADLVEFLAEMLDAFDPPVRIVLDDVHELTGREVLSGLDRLIRRRPEGVHAVLASRSDPPVSVPRLRLEGRLIEVRADLLRFTAEETSALLVASGLDLSPDQVAVLHARTEGWAAGLRLAALALHRADDPDRFLTQFSGDERSVAEYLTGEILESLTPEAQDFLRAVSLCSSLPAELAVHLASRDDAPRLLETLRSETALVERTSPGEYRIHPLLRSHLTADLARTRPDDYRRRQAAAAWWWLGRDQPVHALHHAQRGGDPELISRLVHRSGLTLLLSGDLGPLRRALAAVGAERRTADPWLALTAAITHLEARALPAASAELRAARRSWPAEPDAGLEALRTSAELLAAGQGLATEAVVDLPDATHGAPEVEALLHASRGAAEFGNPDGPDVDVARSELEKALELARSQDLGYLEVQSLTLLATVTAVGGDYPGMVVRAEQAVAAAARRGRHPSAWSAAAMGMLAYADLLGGDPAAAAARAEEALSAWDSLPPEAAYTLHAVHGAALADQGRRSPGHAEVRAARIDFASTPAPPSLCAALGLLEHRAALLNGSLGPARDVAEWLTGRVGRTGETVLLDAWTEAAMGRHEAARTTVAAVFRADTPLLLPHTVVEAHLVDAESALQADEPDAGRTALELALLGAEGIGVARPFALAGPRTRHLLTARAVGVAGARFLVQVGTARTAVVPDAAALLSDRELAVLAMLPSLLTAGEIAAEFTVSVNTVKSHVRSIYAKLGVSSRRDAVVHARERGLLP
jgi:LuxR family transcriptional regulator, maltose regulon positive regulatory protein